jgi:hypothetical protein
MANLDLARSILAPRENQTRCHIFLKNTVQTQAPTYARRPHPYERTRTPLIIFDLDTDIFRHILCCKFTHFRNYVT